MKRHTTRKRNRKLLRAAWRRRHPRIIFKCDVSDAVQKIHQLRDAWRTMAEKVTTVFEVIDEAGNLLASCWVQP